MRAFRTGAVLAAVAVALLYGAAIQPMASGQGFLMTVEEGLELKAFRTGPLTTNTQRFLPVGRRGGAEVHRFDLILFAFSAQLNPKTVNDQTIQIGTIDDGGAFVQAKGAFYQFPERQLDPASGFYYGSKTHWNWWFFDPTARMEFGKNYDGFDPDTTYTVILPGTDRGARATVKTRDGRRLERTFQTTFRTTSEPFDFFYPTVEAIEATDAPGFPLDGRTDVDPRAGIVVRFSEPMLPGSFYNDRTFGGSTYRVRNGLKELPITIDVSSDMLTLTLRPRRGRFPPSRGFHFLLSRDVADRDGNSLGGAYSDGAYVTFVSGAGP